MLARNRLNFRIHPPSPHRHGHLVVEGEGDRDCTRCYDGDPVLSVHGVLDLHRCSWPQTVVEGGVRIHNHSPHSVVGLDPHPPIQQIPK